MLQRKQKITELLTTAEFERRVKDYARFSHMVFIGDHVFIDNADRRINRRMILRALVKGTTPSAPKWNAEHGDWVGKREFLGTGISLTVVCAIRDGSLTVTVVTAHGRPR